MYLADLWRDVLYAFRLFGRSRLFSAVAISTLALGIGASTTIFTIVDAVVLRPLSFPEPQRLAMILAVPGGRLHLDATSAARLSPAYLHEWRAESRAFEDVAGWLDVRANLIGSGEPLEVLADRTTSNFFSVLRTTPQLGRTFTTSRDLGRVEPEVVLSHGLWQRHFGAAPGVVGRTISFDGQVLTIVGVMPPGLTVRTTELPESRAEMWVPFPLVPGDRVGMGGFLNVIARLNPTATIEEGRAELALIARRIETAYPSYSRDWGVQALPLLDATVKDVRPTLMVLFGAVGILLVIACVNVANLVLSRGASRQREIAVRLALGAAKGRVVRQLFTESLVLAGLGGLLGIACAAFWTEVIVAAIPPGFDLPRAGNVSVNLRALAFSAGVAFSASVFFGTVPALVSARFEAAGLRAAVGQSSTLGRRQSMVGALLIVSEVTLAFVLLADAGMLVRTYLALAGVEPGFEARQVVTLRTTLSASSYPTDERMRGFQRRLLERLGGVAEISAVGTASYLPMSNVGAAWRFEVAGRPETSIDDQHFALVSVVGGDYFTAMGIPLVRGRLPENADTEQTEPVFVVDEALARRHWPGGNPVGAHLTWRRDGRELEGKIIGVVGSVRWFGLAQDAPAGAYWWFPNAPGRDLTIVARTVGAPAAVARTIAAHLKAVDPNQPVAFVRTLEDLVWADLAAPRFTMAVLMAFSIAAVLLAAIGLYGVVAHWTAARTRDIGVRMALGANRADVLGLVMRQSLLLVGAGLTFGAIGALASGRLLAGAVVGVAGFDVLTLTATAVALAGTAAVAAYLPARRAALINPLVAIRTE
jgi:putative ABC transport system permease protein